MRGDAAEVYVWLSYIRVIVIYRFGSKISLLLYEILYRKIRENTIHTHRNTHKYDTYVH